MSGIRIKFRRTMAMIDRKKNRKPLDTRVYATPTQLFLT